MEIKLSEHHYSAIYKITNKLNGKIYIGQAQDFYLRYYEHKKIRGNGYLQRAFKKYGFENFEFSIVEKIDDLNKINTREEYWIEFYKSYNDKIGYNICKTANTTRGRKREPSELDGIRKYRQSCIGEKNAFYGKHHSIESKEKISKSRVNFTHTKETKEKLKRIRNEKKYGRKYVKVKKIHIETKEVLCVYDSISEAARQNNTTQSSISVVLNKTPRKSKGKMFIQKTAGGFNWERC